MKWHSTGLENMPSVSYVLSATWSSGVTWDLKVCENESMQEGWHHLCNSQILGLANSLLPHLSHSYNLSLCCFASLGILWAATAYQSSVAAALWANITKNTAESLQPILPIRPYCQFSMKTARWPEGDPQQRRDRRGFLGLYPHSVCSTTATECIQGAGGGSEEQQGFAGEVYAQTPRCVTCQEALAGHLSGQLQPGSEHRSNPFPKELLTWLSSLPASPYFLGRSYTKKGWKLLTHTGA